MERLYPDPVLMRDPKNLYLEGARAFFTPCMAVFISICGWVGLSLWEAVRPPHAVRQMFTRWGVALPHVGGKAGARRRPWREQWALVRNTTLTTYGRISFWRLLLDADCGVLALGLALLALTLGLAVWVFLEERENATMHGRLKQLARTAEVLDLEALASQAGALALLAWKHLQVEAERAPDLDVLRGLLLPAAVARAVQLQKVPGPEAWEGATSQRLGEDIPGLEQRLTPNERGDLARWGEILARAERPAPAPAPARAAEGYLTRLQQARALWYRGMAARHVHAAYEAVLAADAHLNFRHLWRARPASCGWTAETKAELWETVEGPDGAAARWMHQERLREGGVPGPQRVHVGALPPQDRVLLPGEPADMAPEADGGAFSRVLEGYALCQRASEEAERGVRQAGWGRGDAVLAVGAAPGGSLACVREGRGGEEQAPAAFRLLLDFEVHVTRAPRPPVMYRVARKRAACEGGPTERRHAGLGVEVAYRQWPSGRRSIRRWEGVLAQAAARWHETGPGVLGWEGGFSGAADDSDSDSEAAGAGAGAEAGPGPGPGPGPGNEAGGGQEG